MAQTVKRLPAMCKASDCNVGDPGSILGQEDPLQEGMATHSSTLVRKTQWMVQLGRVQSIGSQKARTQLNRLSSSRQGKRFQHVANGLIDFCLVAKLFLTLL